MKVVELIIKSIRAEQVYYDSFLLAYNTPLVFVVNACCCQVCIRLLVGKTSLCSFH